MDEVYLNFNLPINQDSCQSLFKVIQSQLQASVKTIVLLISSPGGNVDPGIAIYNFLKGLPVDVITHNYGSCDSIAALVFCAGSKRFTVSNSRFLLHGIGLNFPNQRMEEKNLKEVLNSITNQRETISKIIAKECNKKVETVEKDILDGIIMNSRQSIEYGLATEIKNELIPNGKNFINIELLRKE